jgi:quercetin 2,3-dioxygenase
VQLPMTGIGGFSVTVFLGSLGGLTSPAQVFSPLVGAELAAGPQRDASGLVPLVSGHEHVIFVAAGSAAVATGPSWAADFTGGTVLRPGQLLYLATGRHEVGVSATAGSRLFLLGGAPLCEQLLMWWNFVARTPDEITAAAAGWREGRFGIVADYDGDPLPAPPLDPVKLRPRS